MMLCVLVVLRVWAMKAIGIVATYIDWEDKKEGGREGVRVEADVAELRVCVDHVRDKAVLLSSLLNQKWLYLVQKKR